MGAGAPRWALAPSHLRRGGPRGGPSTHRRLEPPLDHHGGAASGDVVAARRAVRRHGKGGHKERAFGVGPVARRPLPARAALARQRGESVTEAGGGRGARRRRCRRVGGEAAVEGGAGDGGDGAGQPGHLDGEGGGVRAEAGALDGEVGASGERAQAGFDGCDARRQLGIERVAGGHVDLARSDEAKVGVATVVGIGDGLWRRKRASQVSEAAAGEAARAGRGRGRRTCSETLKSPPAIPPPTASSTQPKRVASE